MKSFKQFQEEMDKDMVNVMGGLGAGAALAAKAIHGIRKKTTSMNTANKGKTFILFISYTLLEIYSIRLHF